MTNLELDAVYQNGVLEVERPLPVADGQRVKITIHLESSPSERGFGIMGWTGSAQDLEYLALSEELDPNESP